MKTRYDVNHLKDLTLRRTGWLQSTAAAVLTAPILLTAMARLPHPVRPKLTLWLQGALILVAARDLVIPECQSRTPKDWVGHLPRRALNLRNGDRLFWFRNVEKNCAKQDGEVLSKKSDEKILAFSLVLLPRRAVVPSVVIFSA